MPMAIHEMFRSSFARSRIRYMANDTIMDSIVSDRRGSLSMYAVSPVRKLRRQPRSQKTVVPIPSSHGKVAAFD